jgi:WD40 repeat protein
LNHAIHKTRTLSCAGLAASSRILAWALVFSLSAPVWGQERPRILVPEEPRSEQNKQTQKPGGPRPELVLQTGVTVPATIIEYSPDGRLIASMSFQGGVIKLWETATGRELCNLNLGNRSAITSARNSAFAFSPDSKKLISFGAGVIKTWDTGTGTEQGAIAVNGGYDVALAAFSGDARMIAILSQTRGAVTVHDTATGKSLFKFDPDQNADLQVDAIGLTSDGGILATSEESHGSGKDVTSLVLREIPSGRVLRTTKVTEEKIDVKAALSGPIRSSQPLRTLRFTPDGRSIVMAIRDLTYEQAAGSMEQRAVAQQNIAKVWEVSSGRETQTITLPNTSGQLAQPEIMQFVIASGVATSYDSNLIAVAANAETRVVRRADGQTQTVLPGNGSTISAVCFSPDNSRLLTAGIDSSIRIWDLTAATPLAPPKLVVALGAGAVPITSLAFSRDDRSLTVGGTDSVNIWEFATGASLKTLELAKPARNVEDLLSGREGAHLGDGGQFVISEGGNEVAILDARTGRQIRSVPRRSAKPVPGSALSADGKLLALPDEVSAVAASSSTVTSAPSVPSIASAPPATPDPSQKKSSDKDDKKRDKAAKQQQDALKEMERMAKSGKMPAGMPDLSQMQKIMEAAQSGDMAKIQEAAQQMAGSMPGALGVASKPAIGVRLVNVEDGKDIASFGGARSLSPVEHASISLSNDSRLVASVTAGQQIRLNETATGRELANIVASRAMNIQKILLSPDSRLLVAAVMETKAGLNILQFGNDPNPLGLIEFTLRVWDVSDPARPKELKSMTGHTGMVSALAFSRNGRTLASGGYDTTVRLWDPEHGSERAVFTGHSLAVTSLQFNEDGSQLVSGSDDGSARLWQTSSGELLCTLVTLNRGSDWLVITPDGLFDGTPAAWNQLLWRFSRNIFDVTPVEVFFNEFYYPGLLTAIAGGARPKATANVAEKNRRQPIVKLSRGDGQTAGVPVTSRNLKVQIDLSSPSGSEQDPAGANDVRLFRNGSLVKLWRGDVLKGQSQRVLDAEVTIVAGENRLTAYAFNRDNVKSVDAVLDLTGAAALKRKGTAYILAFGVNRYANEQYNLKYAVPDARSFAEELRKQQGKLDQYERIETITLADQEVTKENILLALKGLSSANAIPLPPLLSQIKPAQPEDAVIIFFAGHGTARGARFYLVPHDLDYTGSRTAIDAAAIDTILKHSVSDLELEAAIEGLDADRVMLVIDACNSGQALEAEEKRRGPMNSKGLAQLAYEKGIYILTAAQSYQAALEASELGHGYLTYALVEEGLKQGLADRDAKDGAILGREWFNYATERVPEMQEKGMRASRLLLFVESDTNIKDPGKRSIQRPRVFYRRELENHPLVIARP